MQGVTQHLDVLEAVSGGWPKILSNLKSLLEMGAVAFEEPYSNKN